MPANNTLERTVNHRGRIVLAMDSCSPMRKGGGGWPLNSVVRHLVSGGVKWALP
jgi:hypothetical protein